MSKRRFVGLDVHKDTIVIAVSEEGQSEAAALGTFPQDVAKVVKRLVKLEADVSRLRVCYEAGPTGFGLCRRLKQAGIDYLVVTPSQVPRQSGARVKMDRRDARRLAHLLRSGRRIICLCRRIVRSPVDAAGCRAALDRWSSRP